MARCGGRFALTRETIEEILREHASENANCDTLLDYHLDGVPCAETVMLDALRADTRLALYLHSSISVFQIASAGGVDGEARYAVYRYDALAERLDADTGIEDWTVEPRGIVERSIEERDPRVIHVDDSELVAERSPWMRTDDGVGRVKTGPEARP